jgi:hypothetical protein
MARTAKYGFPVRHEKAFIERIKRVGLSITVVGEKDKYMTKVKERLPKYSLVFQPAKSLSVKEGHLTLK